MAIDEVHLLNDNRGSTLEVCLTRTKIRAESRFVLVSATAPNIVDVANWIGARDGRRPAIVKQVRSLGVVSSRSGYYPPCSSAKSSDPASSAVLSMLILEAISTHFNSRGHCKRSYLAYFNNMLKGNLPSSSALPVKVSIRFGFEGV